MRRDAPISGKATGRRRNLLAALSPVVLMAVCIPVQHAAGVMLGAWAWVPTVLMFWTTITIAVVWFGGRQAIARWLQPAQGAAFWGVLAAREALFNSEAGHSALKADVARKPTVRRPRDVAAAPLSATTRPT